MGDDGHQDEIPGPATGEDEHVKRVSGRKSVVSGFVFVSLSRPSFVDPERPLLCFHYVSPRLRNGHNL